MSLELDGSLLEGGGQILRNSIALSALLGKPIKILNIRANRSQKGLKAQHLCGVRLVKRISNADVQGDALRSSFVSFSPNDIIGIHDLVDVGTAGSIALLIQISLPVLLFADKRSEVTLRGGTNATAAPQIDYVESIFMPTARRLLFSAESKSSVCLNLRRRGYYPKGGGEVQLTVEPLKEGQTLSSFDLTERGDVLRIHGRIFISGNVRKTFLSRMASKVKDTLYTRFSKKIIFIDEVQEDPRVATGDAWGLMLWCETSNGNLIAASGIGERGLSPETLAHKAASDLLRDVDAGGCVDEYLQDQLIIYMALARGESSMLTGPLTLHTRTAIHFVQVLTGIKFEITEVSRSDQGQPSQYLISCTGLGLKGKAKIS